MENKPTYIDIIFKIICALLALGYCAYSYDNEIIVSSSQYDLGLFRGFYFALFLSFLFFVVKDIGFLLEDYVKNKKQKKEEIKEDEEEIQNNIQQ